MHETVSTQTSETVLSSALDRKRFQPFSQHQPRITVDLEGTVLEITKAALRLLEFSETVEMSKCFFTLVHGRNLRQVMSDVGDMVHHGKAHASWLLRLRTGHGRWRWYKVTARPFSTDVQRKVQLTLCDVQEW